MERKITSCLVCMLVLASGFSALLMTVKVDTVKAEDVSVLPSNPLNMTYVWNWTQKLANIIYSYHDGEIPRGRAFGSHGAIRAKDLVKNEMINMSLVDAHEEQIKHINTKPGKYYTSIINVTDFTLTVNNPNYPFPLDVPINESFAIPSAFIPRNRTTNFTNTIIVNENLTNTSLLGSLFNYSMTNLSGYHLLNTNPNFVGNVTFLSENATIPNQEHQQGTIFLINNSAQSQNQLDNLTYASGCIVINPNTRYTYPLTTDQNSYTVMNVSQTNGDLIHNLTKNYSLVLADIENNKLVLYYNITEGSIAHLNQNYIVVDRIPTHYEMRTLLNQPHAGIANYSTLFTQKNLAHEKINFHHPLWPQCVAFVLFNTFDQHFMNPSFYSWDLPEHRTWEYPSPAIPTYSLNNTVGEFIVHNKTTTTLSGFINQEYEWEGPNHVGVTAYNVLGNITSPNTNQKAVISSRLDGWFGQTTGDSGAANALVLGLAKYFKDNTITPKYDLTFLLTTGEEYGLRGAEYYNDRHSNDNIKIWFVIDELAFNQPDTIQEIAIQNATGLIHWPILQALIQDTNYTGRTGYQNINHSGPIHGTEQAVYGTRATIDDTICIAKDYYYEWDRYHSTGHHFNEGDALNYTDSKDLDVSAELALNISKYWLMNTDCHFSSKQYTATSSTGGTIPDSIKATFTVISNLPNDKVMINATLIDAASGLPVNHAMMNYTTNRTGIQKNITIAMPTNVSEGDYYVQLQVYNSTARINRIADTHYQGTINYQVNDTNTSATFHLNHYHTVGDIRIGTQNQNANCIIRGSLFTPQEDALVNNITIYVSGGYNPTPTYQCLIYRASDGQLIAASGQKYTGVTYWLNFTFSPKPILRKNTNYILCAWGNSLTSHIYSTSQTNSNAYSNGSYTFGNPPQHIVWDPTQGLYQYSIYCTYNPHPPIITNITNNPSTIGFGQNETITATITDDGNDLQRVYATITRPDTGQDIINMTHTQSTYSCTTNNTWKTGQYTYTITAIDNTSNVTSPQHTFNVSAQTQISVSTTKDTYTGTQYINLTDPPNPPQNYTLIDRGLTWNKYYDLNNDVNVLEVSPDPINCQNTSGSWTPINYTLQNLNASHPAYSYGYRISNDNGLYSTYFKPDLQNTWPVAFAYNKSQDPTTSVVRTKLLGVGYLDPSQNWSHVTLQQIQNSTGQTNDNTITYPNAFTGTDVVYRYQSTSLKEDIQLSTTAKTALQNHPPSSYGLNTQQSYLVFLTKLDALTLHMYNGTQEITANTTIPSGQISFNDAAGLLKCAMPIHDAYETQNPNHHIPMQYRLIKTNNDWYLFAGCKYTDLLNMNFPVVIDPTITIYTSSSDGHLQEIDTNYTHAWTAPTCNGTSSFTLITIGQNKGSTTYGINRGYVFFNTSSLPSNAIIDNATLSLYKASDYSATDFKVTIQNGQPTYPHSPLQVGDYGKSHYSGNGGAYNTASLVNGYNNITLNTTGLSWINRTGWTKFCLRSSRDIAGTAPTGNEYVNFYASEQGTGYKPKLTIAYRNQSKIKNTGSTDIKGYLRIQVQFNSLFGWILDSDVIHEGTPRTITAGHQLGLDTVFNGHIRVNQLQHGAGTYRIYATFSDPNGNILVDSAQKSMVATWPFTRQ